MIPYVTEEGNIVWKSDILSLECGWTQYELDRYRKQLIGEIDG